MSERISTELAAALPFPPHCSLTLEHNRHRNHYQPLAEWIANNPDWCDWESEEAKQRAIATDECWTLRWYPDTPVGFCAVAAPTLAECLALAMTYDEPALRE